MKYFVPQGRISVAKRKEPIRIYSSPFPHLAKERAKDHIHVQESLLNFFNHRESGRFDWCFCLTRGISHRKYSKVREWAIGSIVRSGSGFNPSPRVIPFIHLVLLVYAGLFAGVFSLSENPVLISFLGTSQSTTDLIFSRSIWTLADPMAKKLHFRLSTVSYKAYFIATPRTQYSGLQWFTINDYVLGVFHYKQVKVIQNGDCSFKWLIYIYITSYPQGVKACISKNSYFRLAISWLKRQASLYWLSNNVYKAGISLLIKQLRLCSAKFL